MYNESKYMPSDSVLIVDYALVIAEIDKRKIMKVVKKACAKRKKISLLKDVKIRKRF